MPNPENIRPPKPGEIRNPKGRGKGVKNTRTIIRDFLNATQDKKNPISGETEKLSIHQQMVLALIGKVMKGDVAAFRELIDRFEGKVVQKEEHSVKVQKDELDLSKLSLEETLRLQELLEKAEAKNAEKGTGA